MNVRLLLWIVAFLTIAPPNLAFAGVRPWIAGSLGGSSYAMQDVNDDIDNLNAAIAGTGLSMEEISKGLNFGVALGMDVGSGFALGFGFDRLAGSSDVGDYSASIEYELPANLVRAFGRYSFESAGKAQGHLEVSLGRVMSAGNVAVSITGVGSETGDLEGSGLAFEAGGGVSLWAAPQFGVTGAAGFRHAIANKVEMDGARVYTASGDDYSLDYSGLFLRVGLIVALSP